ncbi:hypothetical protein LLH00_05905 [bacterium]|nr:hypothetical protein [bacterium]
MAEVEKRIRSVVGELNLRSEKALARKAGVHHTTLSNFLYKGTGHVDTRNKIQEAIKPINLEWVLSGEGDKYLDKPTEIAVESSENRGDEQQLEEIVRRVIRQEIRYFLEGKVKLADKDHLNNLLDQAIAREQELERELELERRRRIPDLDRYRRNKETIQALKENHPEYYISEDDEEDFCINHLGFYGGVLSTNVMGEIERLRERRRLVDNVKDLFGQQPELAKKLLVLLEQTEGLDRLKYL